MIDGLFHAVRRRGAFGLAAAGLLLATAAAVPAPAAAATWTTASDVAFPASYGQFLDDNSGAGAKIRPGRPAGLIAWGTPGRPETSSGSTLVPLHPDGTIGRQLTVDGDFEDVGFDARGTATALFTGERDVPPDGETVAGLTWQRIDRAGGVRASGTLSQALIGGGPVIATNPRGDTVVAWLDLVGDVLQLRESTHRAGVGQSGFSEPVTLAVDPTYGVSIAVAISDEGRILLAYAGSPNAGGLPPSKISPAQTYVFTAPIGGQFTGPVAIGRRGDTNVTAALDGRGRGYVMWQGRGRRASPQLATIAPRGKAFSKAIDLDPSHRDYAEPILATDSTDGGAVVAWSRDKPYPLLATTIGADGDVANTHEVGRGLPVALAVRNGAAALATDDGLALGRLKIAVRTGRAKPFGTFERVSREPLYLEPDALAFDPDGRVRVTADIYPHAKRAPRLLTLVRSPG